jgi:glycerate 2-kinase
MAQVLNRSRLIDHGEGEMRELAIDLAEEALAALRPSVGLRRSVLFDGEELVAAGNNYDLSAFRKIVVLGAGKASGELALALEQMLASRLTDGLVVVPRGVPVLPKRISVMEADHPLPTYASADAGRALLERAAALSAQDLAICAFTGGSSALASLPPPGVSVSEKRYLHQLLLSTGMSIIEINTVRKHVSAIKGGRLARAISPARILNVTVSDVIGDPLDCITDLTVQDTSSVADAIAVLEEYQLMGQVPRSVREYLLTHAEAESPQLSDVDIATEIVLRGEDGIDAVLAAARSQHLVGVRLGSRLEGDAASVGRVLATLPREAYAEGAPWPRNTVVVGCGGEYTVTLDSNHESSFGKGGPSQEAAIGAALALSGSRGVVALFLDTDGSDGGTTVAGGLIDWSTEARARQLGVSLRKTLLTHGTTVALEALGDAIVTGPTHTNVNDLVILVIRLCRPPSGRSALIHHGRSWCVPWPSLRRNLIDVAVRTARHGRGEITVHLPEGWHHQDRVVESVRSCLRPATGSGGLTSPNPGHRNPRTARRGHPALSPDPEDRHKAAAEAGGGTPTPAITWGNSSYRNRAGDDLPQFAGRSRLRVEGRARFRARASSQGVAAYFCLDQSEKCTPRNNGL